MVSTAFSPLVPFDSGLNWIINFALQLHGVNKGLNRLPYETAKVQLRPCTTVKLY